MTLRQFIQDNRAELDQFDLAHPSVVVELYEQFEAYQQNRGVVR